MRSLSISSLSKATWSLYKDHWKVFLTASLVPFVLTLIQNLVDGHSRALGGALAVLAVAVGFLSYYFQTEYAIALSEGKTPEWKKMLQSMQVARVWRILRTNIWMVFIIVWPMFVLVAIAGVLGFIVGQNSLVNGTTLSLLAMGVAAVIGAIVSFIRSLSYTLMLYLAFTTSGRVRTLSRASRKHMMGNRIKFLKLVLLQIVAGIVAAFSVVLLPIVQSLVYIIMVLFAQRVVHKEQVVTES